MDDKPEVVILVLPPPRRSGFKTRGTSFVHTFTASRTSTILF